ncbi:MAG: hypothetical protein R2851_27385 [Caldilineaceae bacterium]
MLHGPAATGKRAAALRLLSRLAFGPTPTRLYELNPDLDLADLRPDAPLPDTALLLECSHAAIVHADPLPVRNPAPRARAPGRTPLRAAAAATTRWSSSPTAARGRAWGLSRRVLDWPDTAAAQRLVVVKHLQHALGRTDADPAPADGQAAPDAPADDVDPVTARLNAVMDDLALAPLLAARVHGATGRLAAALLPWCATTGCRKPRLAGAL